MRRPRRSIRQMIPLHRPAFGVGAVLRAALFPRGTSRDLHSCEAAHATASGCPEAVWLPSGRAGIAWALRAAISPTTKIIGPGFTCSVVHEAMVRAGGNPCIIDAATDSFAMQTESLAAARTVDHALVLSEPYGHPYDLDALARHAGPPPRIRIVDSAMAVPQRLLFDRLRGNDFAVVSFGSGKNSYAGWGAMGFTRDSALAMEVRKRRDAFLIAASMKLTAKRAITIGLRTAAQHPWVFSVTRKLYYQAQSWRASRNPQAQPAPTPTTRPAGGFPAAWTNDLSCSSEWRLPATRIDRELSLRNLDTAAAVHTRRVQLARRYHANLAGVPGLLRPPVSPFALSHYTIRVGAESRDRIKQELYLRGVYTISLWAFNTHLERSAYPNTALLCAEVISLPLSQWMNESQVDEVCEKLRAVLSRTGKS